MLQGGPIHLNVDTYLQSQPLVYLYCLRKPTLFGILGGKWRKARLCLLDNVGQQSPPSNPEQRYSMANTIYRCRSNAYPEPLENLHHEGRPRIQAARKSDIIPGRSIQAPTPANVKHKVASWHKVRESALKRTTRCDQPAHTSTGTYCHLP